MTPFEEGTATARGLSCRTCASPPTPLVTQSGMDGFVKALFSPPVFIPVLIVVVLIEFALVASGWNDLLAKFGR
ncbi:MAG: hypothetical protein SFW67_17575 [Myxococcaceae bacterium]|nr:hypothetical protein [Myxococcaceae bacterium]